MESPIIFQWSLSIERRAARTLNYERGLQLSKLEERAKLVHYRMILRKNFALGLKALLYDSRLHLFSYKLRSSSTGPFVVTHVFASAAIEIQDLATRAKQKVNR